MKKLFVCGLVVSLVMLFSVGVLAVDPLTGENFEINEGWYTNYSNAQEILSDTWSETATGSSHVTVQGVTTSGNTPDYNEGDFIGNQEINVTINTSALIPCYLEMELTGNAGYTHAKSVGVDAQANIDRRNESHWMLFNPEFGGLMDASWNLLGNADINSMGLGEGLFINACDMWNAKLFANIPYGFDVEATALSNGSEEFNMDMRVAGQYVDISGNGNGHGHGNQPNQNPIDNFVEYSTLGTANIGTYGALEDADIFMQFRVPFNDQVPAGQYDGDITFSMYSL